MSKNEIVHTDEMARPRTYLDVAHLLSEFFRAAKSDLEASLCVRAEAAGGFLPKCQ
jgi:hypothetical protein